MPENVFHEDVSEIMLIRLPYVTRRQPSDLSVIANVSTQSLRKSSIRLFFFLGGGVNNVSN